MANPDRLFSVNTRASIAASIAGTLMVNGLAAAADRLPTVTVCEPPRTDFVAVEPVTVPVPMRYGRRYAADSLAGVLVDPTAPDRVVATYRGLQARGLRVDRIVDTGHASSDNTGTGPNGQPDGNFTDTNFPANIALADRREKAVSPLVDAALSAQGITHPPIESAPPVEDRLSINDLKDMTGLSAANGYPSATYMQNVYDGIVPGEVKAAVRGFLDQHFGAERRVDVTMYPSQPVVTQECDVVPVGVPVPVPVFKAAHLIDFVPTTGPEKHVHDYPAVKLTATQWQQEVPHIIMQRREHNFSKQTHRSVGPYRKRGDMRSTRKGL